MATTHSEMAGLELHEPYHFVQESDPGAVGAKKMWLKVSTGEVKRRNEANSAWVAISPGNLLFTELTDGPGAFAGQALKVPRVNAGETALEYYTPSGGGSQPDWVTDSPDTPPVSPDAMDDEFDGPTLDAKWTWLNQGSASLAFTNSLARFDVDTTGGQSVRAITQAIPSGTWEIITKLTPIGLPSSTTGGTSGTGYGTTFMASGMALRESGTGKLSLFWIIFDGSLRAYVQRFSNTTTFTSTNYFYDQIKPQQWYWMKIKKTASLYEFYFSHDGLIYYQFGSETVGAYITADEIGICMNAISGAKFSLVSDYFRRLA